MNRSRSTLRARKLLALAGATWLSLGAQTPQALAAKITPSSLTVIDFQPQKFEFNDDFSFARGVLGGQGYDVISYVQESVSLYPTVTLESFIDAISTTHGLFLHSSHGDYDNLEVEAYEHSDDGRIQRDITLASYISSGIVTSTQAIPAEVPTAFIIAITPAGAHRYRPSSGTVFTFITSCWSAGMLNSDGWDTTVRAGYAYSPSQSTADQDVITLFNRLDGSNVSSYGLNSRDVLSAIQEPTQIEGLNFVGNGGVVLTPAVESYAPAPNSVLAGPTPGWVQFDTEMRTSVSPSDIVQGNTVFQVRDGSWPSVTMLSYTIVPDRPGQGSVSINGITCVSSGGAYLNTEGVGSAGISLILPYESTSGQNPAVSISSFTATPEGGGNRIRFATGWEFYSGSFTAQRLDAGGGVLASLPPITPSGGALGASYEVMDVQGAAGDIYRVLEHQTGGRPDLTYGNIIAGEAEGVAGSGGHDPDSLAAIVDALGNPGAEDPESVDQAQFVLVCPDSFVTALGAYQSLWAAHGQLPSIVSLTTTQSQGGVIPWLQNAAGHGVRYVLLVGDANDAAWWDDPTKWSSNGWVWPPGRTPPVPSHPEFNLIPTTYTADADTSYLSMSFYTPYYASDVPYADVDGDGLPDLVVGRLPANSVQDINAYTAKLSSYLANPTITNSTDAHFFTWTWDEGRCLGAVLDEAADTLETMFPASVTMDRWDMGPNGNVPQVGRNTFIENQESLGRGLTLWMGTASSPGQLLGTAAGLGGPITPPKKFTAWLALSCGMGTFDMSNLSGLITPTGHYRSELALFTPDRGPILVIGPSRGTRQAANIIFAEELLQQIYRPGNSFGTAFMQAQRASIVRCPEYKDVFRSYTLLGDPLVGAPASITAVAQTHPAVRAGLTIAGPNPFNPRTVLAVTLTSSQSVHLAIYDVHGRRVRALLNGKVMPAGRSQIAWQGETDSGSNSASGVYFARMQAGQVLETKRLVLLK